MANGLAMLLKSKFSELQTKNPRFSARALARKIDIPPGRLSELMSGKKKLSLYYAEKITKGLGLGLKEAEELRSLVSTQSRKILVERELIEQEIALISSWEHYAILNLIHTKNFKSDSAWIASRLNISKSVVEKSLSLLEKIGLIETRDGAIRRPCKSITTTVDIPSQAIRQAHKNDLLKASEQIDKISPDLRDFSSITMAIDLRKLNKAKQLIATFRNKMSKLLESDHRTEIYNLNIQLYPLTSIEQTTEQIKGKK